MTYKILTNDTKVLIYRSWIRLYQAAPNLRLTPVLHLPNDTDTDDSTNSLESSISTAGLPSLAKSGLESDEYLDDLDHTSTEGPHAVTPRTPRGVVRSNERPMAHLDLDKLIGCTYLLVPEEDGTQTRM